MRLSPSVLGKVSLSTQANKWVLANLAGSTNGGAKVQVTGHRSQVRSQVKLKNACEFAVSSNLVRIYPFISFFV